MSGALDGVRVIDFGQYVAGPLAAMLLADQGADVVRVDPPGGPRYRTSGNATWNRGKRSIVLDLKQADDLEVARRLIDSADVVIENFRPGVMDRLGIGPDATISSNPALIYCSLPGFASDDPRAALPGWEGLVGAAAGSYLSRPQLWMTDAGTGKFESSEDPVYTAVPVSSAYAGFLGATSVTMALIARDRDGRGQQIEVPLFDATFFAAGAPNWGVDRVGSPWARQYECADGRWIHLMASNERFVRQFLEAAGVEHWANESFVGITGPMRQSPEQATELLERLTRLFRTRSAQEWEDAINAAGTAACICRTSADWLEHPHARESKMIIELDDPEYGRMRQPGLAVRLNDTPGSVRAPAPTLDQHRDEILAELSIRQKPAQATSIEDSRPPLADMRLMDLGIVLAGPTCGRTLMEFGADTIKVDAPGGGGPASTVSRGKRSILLDLNQDAGRNILWGLIDSSDVLLQNFRKGVVGRLGFDYEEVRKRKPGLVYISINAYGYEGPWAGRPGWEYQAQAATGMQERFGGGSAALQPFPVCDYATGILGTFAVALALYNRNRTGQGQHVNAALAYTATFLQSGFLNSYDGKVWDQPRGQHALGAGHLYRMYRAADGWLFLAAPDVDLQLLESVPGLAGIEGTRSSQVGMFLEERISDAPVAEWVDRLTGAGVGAHAVMTLPEAMDSDWAREHGLRLVREHPDGGIVDTIGPVVRMQRTPLQPGSPLRPSLDAEQILAEIQMEHELEGLVEHKVVEIRQPVVSP